MKKVLITGASGGIGSEVVKKFVGEGYFVIGLYNKGELEIKKLSEEFVKEGLYDRFVFLRTDFSDDEIVNETVKELEKCYKYIDVLVNVAGVSLIKQITETTEKEWDNLFNVNVKSVYKMSNFVLPGMIERKSGSIVNVSSIWGEKGASCEVCYSASKGAIVAYTKALAKEVALSGIRVNAVSPGVIDTKMNGELTKSDIDELCTKTPLSRLGKPKEVADLIYFLASEQASFITGQIITVDGGFNL